ncbi:THAP domain-containing protein 5 [Strongylocentrotus purpuratus]|uniref:THAP-type domain-containing protein n=1 Tax=Strongylocentrotus purpuratus TaxID=7668 RepID=A0A7M7RFA5_STRPU|nr:THAP domain-containing protein 5 [Strongylocentrotus purpuratus]
MSSCAATNCKNRSDRAVVRGRSFHRLPLRDPALLKVWLSQMGRESWKPRPSSAICSDHFEKICFDRTGQTTRIRESAVPTLFNLPRVPFKPKKTKTTKQKKEIVIKFPPKKLRSGKQLAAPAPGVRAGSPHDHDYLGKGGFLNQEQLKSQSQHGDMNDPLKKLRSGKQLAAPAPVFELVHHMIMTTLEKEAPLIKKQADPAVENSLQMWTVGQMHRVIGKAATKIF